MSNFNGLTRDDYGEPKLSSEFKTLSHYGRKIYNTSKLKVTHVSLYSLRNSRDVSVCAIYG